MAVPALLAAGCRKEAPPETVVTVAAEHPEQGAISEHVTADAVLAPQAQAAITPKISAPVRKFFVQRGAHVKAGELLAELENADLTAAAMDNKGSYEAAQAAYDTATKAQVPEDAQKAELDLALAKANFALNESIVKARKQLLAEGAIPARDLDTAQAALLQARAEYDTAAAHVASMKKVTREAALKSAQGELTSAEGKYKGAAAMVDYSEIRSPIDGYVTDRPLYPGEMAAAGTPLITVMDTATLLAKTHLAQSLVERLKVGDNATMIVPGIVDPVPAKISMISPALDPGSTTVEVWLRIDNQSGALKVGTPAKVTLIGRTVTNALKIPVSAVLTAQDGSKTVMVIGADGAAHSRPVTLGIEDGGDAQVLSGLTTADNVITVGSYGLDEGTKVKIGPAGDEDKGGDADDKKPAAGGKEE
ncbi:MAG: efflux RND transporter periplasmic adaptor subunit [Terracidiphilus sp.]